ncbi:hypothetical protein TYRP_015360 [Tyrophagus putrescentiae]|nr:hypothetical protein TYRP_015360 [Tyrophagus putrescentiae]
MTGPAPYPEVTWPLSTPSSSVVDNGQVTSDLAALVCALLPPQQLCSPAAQGGSGGSGSDSSENGSESAHINNN